MLRCFPSVFFDPTAAPEIYTLSLHDALPISLYFSVPRRPSFGPPQADSAQFGARLIRGSVFVRARDEEDRKSTRLNSSHPSTSYAVFCLKKKTWTNLARKPTSQWSGTLTCRH